MEIIYYIITPIIASVLGGVIGGLFTFLGVKATIQNANALKWQEDKEKNKEKNEKIIEHRPQLQVVSKTENIKDTVRIYALPYNKPELNTPEEIIFDYSDFKIDENFWECKETIICNCGNQMIESSFLELEYKSGINIYTEYETNFGGHVLLSTAHYSDIISLPGWIQAGECIKLQIFYPKKIVKLLPLNLNCYMSDENNNYWYQNNIIMQDYDNKSILMYKNKYLMHRYNGFYKWFIYDHMFWDKNIKKNFSIENFENILKQRKEMLWKNDRENDEYVLAVTNGEILLN